MIDWLHRTMRLWWPFFAALAAVSIIATMSFVTWTVVDERTYFEQEQERDKRQDAAMAKLIESQNRVDRERAARVAEALQAAEALLADQFARHDYNVAVKLNDLLAQIQSLLARPAGTAPQPVHAINTSPVEPPPTTVHRTVTPTTVAPSPTTTAPPHRRCLANPDHPRC